MSLYRSLVFSAVICQSALADDPIKVSVADPVRNALPHIVEMALAGLKAGGVDYEFVPMSNARLFKAIDSGEIALDLIRLDGVIDLEAYPHLIKVEPALITTALYRVVAPGNEAFCTVPAEELKQLSVAGLQGTRIYEEVIFPKYGKATPVKSVDQALMMVMQARTDVAYASNNRSAYDESLLEQLHACDEPEYVSGGHSYLHKSYEYLQPAISAGYRKVLGQ